MQYWLLLSLLLFGTASTAAPKNEDQDFTANLIRKSNETLQAKCQAATQQLAAAKGSYQTGVRTQEKWLMCECLAPEFERLIKAENPATITADTVTKSLQTGLQNCSAKSMRITIPLACKEDAAKAKPPADPDTYCNCMTTGVNRLSDADLIESSARAYREFQAKVEAKSKGLPEPVFEPGEFEKLDQACKKKS